LFLEFLTRRVLKTSFISFLKAHLFLRKRVDNARFVLLQTVERLASTVSHLIKQFFAVAFRAKLSAAIFACFGAAVCEKFLTLECQKGLLMQTFSVLI